MKRNSLGALVLILSIPLALWGLTRYDPVRDPKALAFIEKNLPTILKDWNEQEFLKIVDKEYKLIPGEQNATSEDVHRIFLGNKRRYGKMRKFILNQNSHIGGCSTNNYNTPDKIGCVTEVAFENGNANVIVGLNKYADDYKINFFSVEPPN